MPQTSSPIPADDRLQRDVPGSTLRERTRSAGVIRLIAQLVALVLVIASTSILARLLTPADFGLFAMVNALMAFIGSFRDFGLPNVASYHEDLDQQQMSALFWVNTQLNVLILMFMAGMAPLLAWFYGETRLILMTLVMSLGVLSLGVTIPHEALLTRRMRFGVLALIEISTLLVGILVSIGLAVRAANHWALVGQFLAHAITRSSALWFACGWRPNRAFIPLPTAYRRIQSMLSYSAHVTGARVIAHIGRNLDRVVVGYTGGATAMGLYDKSYQWSALPINQVHGPLVSVLVASLSRVRHDGATYRAYAYQGLLPIFALCMPAVAFMGIEADIVIRFLLGEQWLAAVPLFRLLCLAAFVGCISTVTKALYLAQGETKRQLQWSVIATLLLALAVIIGSRWGVYGVAVGFTGMTCLLAIPSVAFCLHTSHVRPRDFLRIVWRPATASLGAALLLGIVDSLLPLHGALLHTLLIKSTLFSLTYLGLWFALPGGRQMAQDLLRRGGKLWRKRESVR